MSAALACGQSALAGKVVSNISDMDFRAVWFGPEWKGFGGTNLDVILAAARAAASPPFGNPAESVVSVRDLTPVGFATSARAKCAFLGRVSIMVAVRAHLNCR